MSDTSSIVVQLDKSRQLLEISNNIYDCKVLFTIETENETPFEFNVIDEDLMKKNAYTMNKVDNGYVSGTAKNIVKPTYLAIASHTPCKATVTLQQIRNHSVPTVTSRPVQASAVGSPYQSHPALAHQQQQQPPVKFYRKKSFLILVVVVGLVAGYWYMRRQKSKKATEAAPPAAPMNRPRTSGLSVDPTSNDESSFGF